MAPAVGVLLPTGMQPPFDAIVESSLSASTTSWTDDNPGRRFQACPNYKSILHTILFHRALGLVRPKDMDLELFEITYSKCNAVMSKLERKIDEKIDQFIDRVEKHPN
ncbi:hypothetical protein CASFOL_027373 [Castilleja foliolosa]|uniref:Autophagy-related protein 101 n=1 Tax=Castilleja foliolosa TaxID=1961234 RepID=A0ABD3CFP2_9LAMI